MHEEQPDHPPRADDEAHDSDRAGGDAPAGAGVTRRTLLAGAAAAAGGAMLGTLPLGAAGRQAAPAAASREPAAPPQGASPSAAVPPDPTKVPGAPTSAASARSPFVSPARAPVGQITGASFSPIQDFSGTITPTDLHFERHHGGVAQIDAARYKLVVHGLTDRPVVFTLYDLKAFPPTTRIHFLECSGNGRAGYRGPKPELTPQQIDGMVSNAEWTGVRARLLLREAGVKRDGTWVLAEGGDAAVLSRSVPIEKMLDDALVVYAQNGEPLRPAAGYPVRLLLPGWEGNMNIKWLRRLEVVAQPNMSKDETSKYTDPLPNDTARQFSFELDVKSIITSPAHPTKLGRKGWVPVTGLAWSGRGKVARVDVSTDGGRSWSAAELQEPVLTKAAVRFTLPWRWEGGPAVLMSRAADETGAVQPTYEEFARVRGAGTDYHYNHIRAWAVRPDGQVVYDVDGRGARA